jgi:hypothetical protein
MNGTHLSRTSVDWHSDVNITCRTLFLIDAAPLSLKGVASARPRSAHFFAREQPSGPDKECLYSVPLATTAHSVSFRLPPRSPAMTSFVQHPLRIPSYALDAHSVRVMFFISAFGLTY